MTSLSSGGPRRFWYFSFSLAWQCSSMQLQDHRRDLLWGFLSLPLASSADDRD